MMLKSLKQKIAKVGIGLFCAGCVFLSSAAYSQAASYTAYALKLNKTNNFTSMHAKTTSDDYITNEVTAITNTSYANFWAVNNSKSKISNKYNGKLSISIINCICKWKCRFQITEGMGINLFVGLCPFGKDYEKNGSYRNQTLY